MVKNYYAILGVLPTASFEEIRSAYRKGAKRYHPDHFGRDSAAFIDIQEAYDVLSDPANRASYDSRWKMPSAGPAHGSGSEPEIIRPRKPPFEHLTNKPGKANLGEISPLRSFHTFRPSLDEILDYLQNALDIRAHHKAERFQTLTMEVVLTPDQVARGGWMQIFLPLEAECSTCEGTGTTGFRRCWQCGGSGMIRGEFPLEVGYPPSMRDYYQVAIPLDRFGLHDVCAIILFRIAPSGEIEEV